MATNIVPLRQPKAEPTTKRRPRDEARELLEQALDTGVRGSLRDAIKAALDVATAPVKRELTDLNYDALKPGQRLLDPNRPGFLARCTRAGVKLLYRFEHPETGQQKEALLGIYGDITLAEARALWQDLRRQRMDGKVPTLVEEEPSTTDMPSVGKLCRRYLDEYASQVKRSWKDDEWLLSRYILPDFADMPADAFTTDVARKLFQSLDGVPRNRDKLRACLSTMFNVAVGKTKKLTIAEPWLPTSFVNPITNAATATHNADVNFPPLEEGRSYYRALVSNSAALKEDYRDVLLLQLLCASRIREVAEMAWSEVDLAAGRWTLPAARSKNSREHVVLLSAPALELLERRREWTAGPFVFPSSRNPRTQPLRSDLVSSVLAEHRQALGVGPRFTSHNVRHLFSTWAGEKRKPVEVVNRCTAHVVASGINRHYNAAKLDVPAKQLWADWARWLQR